MAFAKIGWIQNCITFVRVKLLWCPLLALILLCVNYNMSQVASCNLIIHDCIDL